MNLSSYIKIQKTLLVIFFVSVAASVFTFFVIGSQTTVANSNANVIKTPTPSPQTDDVLKRKIEEALRKKGFKDVKVDATTESVTLRGNVPTGKLAEAVQLTKEIGGKLVISELREGVPPPVNSITPINDNTEPVNTSVNNSIANSANNASNPPEDAQGGGSYGLIIIGGVSFLTSVCSLLGFVSTTVLAWRKEKRDVETIRIDNEKKELELAKLKMELDKLKSEDKEPKRKRPKPAPRKPKKTE